MSNPSREIISSWGARPIIESQLTKHYDPNRDDQYLGGEGLALGIRMPALADSSTFIQVAWKRESCM